MKIRSFSTETLEEFTTKKDPSKNGMSSIMQFFKDQFSYCFILFLYSGWLETSHLFEYMTT